jgi:group I intron endonuclease
MDYKNGRIYCIRNNIDDEVYVGSTCQPLSKRMAFHRNDATTYKKDRKIYKHMNNIGVENFYIELLEECPCENKEQLRKREGYHIRDIGTLNSQIAGRSQGEYCIDNKEQIALKGYEYRERNRPAIIAQKAKYWNQNKDEANEERRIKITCGCGTCCCKGAQTRHERSNKHKEWLETSQSV